jgi:outer membrane protein
MIKLMAAVAIAALVNTSAHAQWSYGVMGIGSLTPYKGLSSESLVVPIVAYEGERLIWRGPSVQYKLTGLQRGQPSLRVSLELAPNELQANESNELVGIQDRDLSVLGGVRYIYPTAYGEFSAVFQTDLTNTHSGQRGAMNFEPVLFQDASRQWAVTGGVQLEYLSDDYAHYYFGVSAAEAAVSNFTEYQVDAIWQAGLTLGGYYRFNKNWQGIIQTRYLSLADEVSNSPIVDSKYTIDGLIGVTYRF